MIVIVQPWFSAPGHPSQSLINLSKIVGDIKNIIYLIAVVPGNKQVEVEKNKLMLNGEVIDYAVNSSSIREGTLKALMSLKKMLSTNKLIDRIFFLDAHLILLSVLWPFYARPEIKKLGLVYLLGPERVARYGIIKNLVNLFLKRKEVVLFLRTDELVSDWKKAFPHARIKCLPSLELPEDEEPVSVDRLPSDTIRLGVLGQIRVGKSLEWLVPIFKDDPPLGKLTVAGAYSQFSERKRLTVLQQFDGFQEGFLSEDNLLRIAVEQDYLLMLYDNWDERMEGAVMFLAARVHRPVIVYDKGWCGRMVRTYGNGVLAPRDHGEFAAFVKLLPRCGSEGYRRLLDGVCAFRSAHAGPSVKQAFLDIL
ncbi:MAG: hypothetical protein V7721_11520 [Porticoccaceae bacterium]